jgi:hypothetical protein
MRVIRLYFGLIRAAVCKLLKTLGYFCVLYVLLFPIFVAYFGSKIQVMNIYIASALFDLETYTNVIALRRHYKGGADSRIWVVKDITRPKLFLQVCIDELQNIGEKSPDTKKIEVVFNSVSIVDIIKKTSYGDLIPLVDELKKLISDLGLDVSFAFHTASNEYQGEQDDVDTIFELLYAECEYLSTRINYVRENG